MIWIAVVVGVALVLAALFAQRATASLLLMSAGSAVLSLVIAAFAGPLSGVLVATLYAGALIAMMAIWLILAEAEEAKRDALYWVAVAFLLLALPAGLLAAWRPVLQLQAPPARVVSLEDILILSLILVVAAGGVPYVLGGERR
ncbi:MAG: hypothetical protein QXS92_04420 [Thermofilum sp.]